MIHWSFFSFCIGKPSNVWLEKDVDWVPSLKLEKLNEVKQTDYNHDVLDSSENECGSHGKSTFPTS